MPARGSSRVLRAIVYRRKLAKCQKLLEHTLQAGLPQRERHTIGHQGEDFPVNVCTDGEL